MMTLPDFVKKQIIVVTLTTGEKMSFKNDNLIVCDPEGQVKLQTTCYRIFMLCIVGSFTVTTGLIQRSHKFGFPIYLMTNSLKVYDKLGAKMEGNVVLRKSQYGYEGLELAVNIVRNKVLNQLAVLEKRRQKSEALKESIDRIKELTRRLENFSGELPDLLGIEGNIAKLYFKHQFDNVEWKGRKPRVKCDVINSMLDIGYSVLFNMVESLLDVYGFDVYRGVLHRQFYMRKSLVCDLVEPFRVIIDVHIRKAINLKQFVADDFELIGGVYKLKWSSNNKYIANFLSALLDYKNEIYTYIQAYYRAVMKRKDFKDYPTFKFE